MNVLKVQKRLDAIRKAKDWERVHILEDKLLWDFIKVVAEGDIAAMAIYEIADVLQAWHEKSKDEERWYS